MTLIPKKQKFRKSQRRRVRGKATRGNSVFFGEFGLQSLETGYLKTKQIEAGRKALAHFVKRGGKIWMRGCADKPYTERAAETRMGGGKGAPVDYLLPVRTGQIIYEIAGVSQKDAEEGFRLVMFKLPLKCRMVKRV
ncbi:50S ribosomal protein L16 [Candidatus Margulisiibacteriota bacterium]